MTSIILETGARAVFHTIIVFSVFLLFAGHNAPGGGFIGGLVAAAALVLRFVAYGPDDLRKLAPARPEALMGGGGLAAAVAAVIPLFSGGALLQAERLSLPLPLIGTVKLTTVLLFDVGVYFIVVGLVLGVLETLGGEMDQ